MGLSSKQVNSDHGLDWNQTLLQSQNLQLPKPQSMRRQQQQQNLQNQQQPEPLKCPRCDSSNTKFCYYNNYNKLQPRHFCRACKRHWTKGGTLRNVPVGGGRKNKRLKKPTTGASSATSTAATATITTATTTTTTCNNNIGTNRLSTNLTFQQQGQINAPLSLGDRERNISDIFYQALLRPPSSLPHQNLISSSSNLDSKSFSNRSSFLLSDQNHNLHFPFSNSTPFDSNHSSIVSTSFQTSNVYNFADQDFKISAPEPSITGMINTPSTTGNTSHPWQLLPNTSSGMDMSNYSWNWEDIDNLVSTDLNLPWDDSDVKP
ncbi:hypothetical protein FNV43_RR07611 [Rhamnella rubrinervis]|uniref:Dof zinc finger protein n=1 Tax=Rhamnella rubrinervis TaxID=2594499 RepID=A0A8K0HF33_9ROSA|nr:hypothetical protein FNV43_RR07611 [Rhamnella rubrinervis]